MCASLAGLAALPGIRPERWKPGDRAAYTEVFPAGWDLVVPHDEKLFLAVDHYCLDPGCACSDVVVRFVGLVDGSDAGTAVAPLPAKHNAHVSDRADVRALWRALLETTPPSKLRERFRRMRYFARSLVPRIAPLDHRHAARQRDAARPRCAGGKKYKKCHLAEDEKSRAN